MNSQLADYFITLAKAAGIPHSGKLIKKLSEGVFQTELRVTKGYFTETGEVWIKDPKGNMYAFEIRHTVIDINLPIGALPYFGSWMVVNDIKVDDVIDSLEVVMRLILFNEAELCSERIKTAQYHGIATNKTNEIIDIQDAMADSLKSLDESNRFAQKLRTHIKDIYNIVIGQNNDNDARSIEQMVHLITKVTKENNTRIHLLENRIASLEQNNDIIGKKNDELQTNIDNLRYALRDALTDLMQLPI
jgi:hypothetical protein